MKKVATTTNARLANIVVTMTTIITNAAWVDVQHCHVVLGQTSSRQSKMENRMEVSGTKKPVVVIWAPNRRNLRGHKTRKDLWENE